METFIIKLIIAVIPLVALVTVIVLTESRSRKHANIKRGVKRTRTAIRHAFGVAATQKWF